MGGGGGGGGGAGGGGGGGLCCNHCVRVSGKLLLTDQPFCSKTTWYGGA